MPTIVTKTIGSSGRDYATIGAWAAACPADLVAADQVWKGVCYNDSEFVITSVILMSGITSDATRYMHLTVAAGQSCFDAPRSSQKLVYDQSLGVGVRTTTNSIQMIDLDQFARLERIQFKNTSALPGYPLNIDNGSSVRDVLVEVTNNSTYTVVSNAGGSPTLFVNIVVIRHKLGLAAFVLTGGSATCVGCVVMTPADISAGNYGFFNAATTLTLRSCAIFGFGSAVLNGGTTIDAQYCATDASALAGTGNKTSVTYTQATPFTDGYDATLDLRPIVGTDLVDNGFRDATNAPNDVTGTARDATPTIGAWEIVSALSGVAEGTSTAAAVGRSLAAAVGAAAGTSEVLGYALTATPIVAFLPSPCIV